MPRPPDASAVPSNGKSFLASTILSSAPWIGNGTSDGLFAEFLTSQLLNLNKTVAAEHVRLAALREQQHIAALARLRKELDALQQGESEQAVPGKTESQMQSWMMAESQSEPGFDWAREQDDEDHGCPESKWRSETLCTRPCSPRSETLSQEHNRKQQHGVSTTLGSCISNMADVEEILLAAQTLDEKLHRSTGSSMEGSATERHASHVRMVEHIINPVVCLVILFNAFTIGLSMDIEPDWIGWLIVDGLFVTIYVSEMLLKWRIVGIWDYFCGASWLWNIFDFFIVFLSVADVVMGFLWQGHDAFKTSSYTVMRLIRLSRFGRVLRLFEFDLFRELLTMLRGLVSGLRTLVWAFVLLSFPIYALGLALKSILGAHSDLHPMIANTVSNVPTSMFLIFRCSIGDCTLEDGTPAILTFTRQFGWVYGVVYVLTVMIVTFGIFNLIMATFVDNALSAARKNEQIRLRNRLNDYQRQVTTTGALVYKLWKNQQYSLSEMERSESFDYNSAVNTLIMKNVFEDTMMDPEAQKLLEDLDVAEEDRMGLFDVLDADGGGTLQLLEIILGVLKLRGMPRRSDVVQVGLMVRSLQEKLDGNLQSLQQSLLLVHGLTGAATKTP